MTSAYDPPKSPNVLPDAAARKKRLLLRGLIVAAVGAVPLYAGFHYATQLARRVEYRSATLANVMGVCFWSGALLLVIGLGMIVWSQQR